MRRSGKSYTYDTMIEMTKEFPNAAFSFIIGGDMVEYLPKWYHINELIKLVNFVGVNRLITMGMRSMLLRRFVFQRWIFRPRCCGNV
ncbi:nicotinic acid mononucleotide adenylyltransferase [Listeria grandensis FSL F6-0971]|uniref:Nicotinic acid mononucleotide adenylyltransferase n=1 Tax=Listeria grandensis FSL F6-0971 TaxID=1265819 RepID=W7BGF7_9LIST|nr:nicotinic acid mononucleotide adenylyltransferase [Listeria grandensis FSL F6-0971]